MTMRIEEKDQNRRRRRSSISQHFQRMFNIDKNDTQRQHEISQAPSNTNANTNLTTDQQREGAHEHPFDSQIEDQRTSDLSKVNHESSRSLKSKPIRANLSASRNSSIQPTPRGSSSEREQALDQLQGSSHTNGKNNRSETESHNQGAAQKKEKRVTRRLEAERLELEKRLLKLEQTQLSKDHSSSKRESRRLTKKQPIENSSRGSSVSTDEARSSSRRFSAFFSSSRRTSRSRTSAAAEKEEDHLTESALGTKETSADHAPTPRAGNTPLFTSLPERFSAVVSRGLVVENETLLQSYTPPMQSQWPLPVSTSPAGHAERSDQGRRRDGNEESSPQTLNSDVGKIIQTKERRNIQDKIPQPPKPLTSSELDRDSFAATLNLAHRGRESNQGFHRSLDSAQIPILAKWDAAQSKHHHQPQAFSSPKPRMVSEKVNGTINTSSSSSAKPLASNTPQKLPRMTKSSPLAIGASIGNTSSESLNGTNGASPVRNSFQPNGTRRVPTSPLVTVATSISPTGESQQNAQSPASKKIERKRAPGVPAERTSKPLDGIRPSVMGQAKSFPSDVPQSWESHRESTRPESIIDPIQGPQQSTLYVPSNYEYGNKPNLPHANPEEDKDLSVPRSAKMRQGGWNLPDHRPRSRVNSQDIAPRSSLSSRTSSPELCSDDYNTADEAASIKSVPKRGIGHSSDHHSAAPDTSSAQDDSRIRSFTYADEYPTMMESRVEDSQPDRLARKLGGAETSQPVMKNFAICCACKSWHEMPAKVYSKVSSTEALPVLAKYGPSATKTAQKKSSRLTRSTTSVSRSTWPRKLSTSKRSPGEPQKPQLTAGSFAQCCWCTHHMNRQCCEGWTASVQMHQRHRW